MFQKSLGFLGCQPNPVVQRQLLWVKNFEKKYNIWSKAITIVNEFNISHMNL